jgi:hypothetical protein
VASTGNPGADMKRRLIGWAAALLGGVLSLALLQIVASESGEVVVLHTRASDGLEHETRLWVIELDGQQYLRAGDAGSRWYARLSVHPDVVVARSGVQAPYRAVPSAQLRAPVNAAMRAKYGWRDAAVGMFVGGRDGAIPVRLDLR